MTFPFLDDTIGKDLKSHIRTRDPRQQPPLLHTPHPLPLDIQPPHLPPPLLPQRLPHFVELPVPEPQQSSFFHLNPLLEGKLCLYGSEFILVAEEAELDTVMSSAADDIVSARADFVK